MPVVLGEVARNLPQGNAFRGRCMRAADTLRHEAAVVLTVENGVQILGLVEALTEATICYDIAKESGLLDASGP